jgi:predicted phage terminase large subunit-like protein
MNLLRTPGQAGLLVQLPVRHGKSEFFSKHLPPYFLSLCPSKQVLLTGYGSDFASEWGAKARDLFSRHSGKLFNLHLDRKRDDNWSVRYHGGGMHTAGTLGPITGRGADLLIGDDLIKNQREAESTLYRDRVWKWFMGDALTRLEPNGKCILVLSRRHPEDIVGKVEELKDKGGMPWTSIRIPVLSEGADDPLQRPVNTPLWPERFNAQDLEQIRVGLEQSGEGYLWDSLYMQNPQGDPSSTEWPRNYFDGVVYEHTPIGLTQVQSQFLNAKPPDLFCTLMALDPSMGKDAKQGDFSAIPYALMDRRGHLWLEDTTMLRLTSEQLVQTSAQLIVQRKPDAFVPECNNFQEVIADQITNLVATLGGCCPTRKIYSTMNKEVKIRITLTPWLAQKKLHIKNTPGNQLLINQLKAFPTGKHDDGPDALCSIVQAFLEMVGEVQSPTSNHQGNPRLRV